jgi:fluoroacetyl-CoA thioesterase
VSYVPLTIGVCGEVELTVVEADTAIALRSGSVPVLGTPRVVAMCEEAAVAALSGRLAEGMTSVGTRVELAHLAAIRVGSTVRASATLEKAEGKRLVFNVLVNDECGLVAAGKITRVVVELGPFMERAR